MSFEIVDSSRSLLFCTFGSVRLIRFSNDAPAPQADQQIFVGKLFAAATATERESAFCPPNSIHGLGNDMLPLVFETLYTQPSFQKMLSKGAVAVQGSFQ